MQDRHLRDHSIASFLNDNTARTIKNCFTDDNTTAYRKAMHKSAVVSGVVEPGFIDAPVDQFIAQFLIAEFVTVMRGRGS